MIEKRLNSTKKYRITRQYKYLSNEFNPVSLKARYHLRQINSFLKEKKKKIIKNNLKMKMIFMI